MDVPLHEQQCVVYYFKDIVSCGGNSCCCSAVRGGNGNYVSKYAVFLYSAAEHSGVGGVQGDCAVCQSGFYIAILPDIKKYLAECEEERAEEAEIEEKTEQTDGNLDYTICDDTDADLPKDGKDDTNN